jgi:DNA mismatch repair protein MutS
MSIIEYYFELLDKYRQEKGPGTILFMEIGKFYEAYAIENGKIELAEVAKLLSIRLTRKNGKGANRRTEATIKNPYLLGFNVETTGKFVKRLVDNGFTVVLYDQIYDEARKAAGEKLERVLSGIYSPATWVAGRLPDSTNASADDVTSNSLDTNYLATVWLEELPQLKGGKALPALGFACLDLSTGKTMIYECYARPNAVGEIFDELTALAQKTTPREVVVYFDDNEKINEQITKENPDVNALVTAALNCFEMDSRLKHVKKSVPAEWDKVPYQNEVLERMYGKRAIAPLEDFNLVRKPYAVRALIMCLEWAYEHVASMSLGLQEPEFLDNETHLCLGNSAVFQLNILDNAVLESGIRTDVRSLFDVVSKHSSTSVGKRFLKRRITEPMTDPNKIIASHKAIRVVYDDNDLRKQIISHLMQVVDIERLHRKIVLNTLTPREFFQLHECYEHFLALEEDLAPIARYTNLDWIDRIGKMVKVYKKLVIVDKLEQWDNIADVRENIFREQYDVELDEITEKLQESVSFMDWTVKSFNKILGDEGVEIYQTDRDGYQLKVTSIRANKIKKSMADSKRVLKYKDISISAADLEIKKVGSSTRLQFEKFSEYNTRRCKLEFKLSKRTKIVWAQMLSTLYSDWELALHAAVEGLGTLDFIKTAAATALDNNYVQPTIVTQPGGYVKCTGLRHPLIEKIITSAYIPHDIDIGYGRKETGALLYGVNGSGKSAAQKELGLGVVMAQAGMWVPANTFELAPYHNLYARITGHDNLLKSLSSYGMELIELRSILKKTGPSTLVLGDEVCRGTEADSGTAVVAAAVIELIETGTTFIFATHLHRITELPEVMSLDRLGFYHLEAEWRDDRFVYSRKLQPGSGPKIYGLKVAKNIINNAKFTDRAEAIIKRLTATPEVVEKRQSKWNSEVYLTECTICKAREAVGNPLQTHHIQERENSVDGWNVAKDGSKTTKRDHKSNLVVLCKNCHNSVHNKSLNIAGWKQTSKGLELSYAWKLNLELKTAISRMRINYESDDWDKSWLWEQVAAKIKTSMGMPISSAAVGRIWWTSSTQLHSLRA